MIDDNFPDRLRARLDALTPTIAVDTSRVIAGARRRRRGTLVGSGAAILLVVSGVAWAAAGTPWAGSEPADGTFVNGWLRPAWMDEQAEMQAGYIAAYQACVDAKGLDFRVDVVNDAIDTSGYRIYALDPEELQGVLDCQAQTGAQAIDWTLTDDVAREFYGREADVAQCLSHLGFDLGVPPTEEEYLEEVHGLRAIGATGEGWAGVGWTVYRNNDRHLYSADANLFLYSEETHAACPEPWPYAWTPDDIDPDAPPVEVWVESPGTDE